LKNYIFQFSSFQPTSCDVKKKNDKSYAKITFENPEIAKQVKLKSKDHRINTWKLAIKFDRNGSNK